MNILFPFCISFPPYLYITSLDHCSMNSIMIFYFPDLRAEESDPLYLVIYQTVSLSQRGIFFLSLGFWQLISLCQGEIEHFTLLKSSHLKISPHASKISPHEKFPSNLWFCLFPGPSEFRNGVMGWLWSLPPLKHLQMLLLVSLKEKGWWR